MIAAQLTECAPAGVHGGLLLRGRSMEQQRLLIPPVYLAIAIALMTALHFLFPLVQPVTPPYSYAGALLGATGMLVTASAARAFRKADTPIVLFERPTALVTAGLYRFTRNPMYLGMVLMLLGVWLLLGSLSPLLVVAAFVWIIDRRFIIPEERVLEQTFAEEYRRYRANVRRWL